MLLALELLRNQWMNIFFLAMNPFKKNICISNSPVKCRIDDPVGASCVHGVGGAWGMLAMGLFGEESRSGLKEE